jgi:NarL family two-component system response regulator LiaR
MISKIKVAIVDTAEWIDFLTNRVLLQCDDIEVIWSDSTATNTLLKANSRRNLDIILADLNLIDKWYGGFDIIFGIKEIKKVKFITLTREYDDATILNSFTAGAVNCLSKSNFKQLPDAIRTTFYNENLLLLILINDYRRLRVFEAKEKLFTGLTPVQKETMNLYVTNRYLVKEIAAFLHKKRCAVERLVWQSAKKMKLKLKKFGNTGPVKGYQKQIY